MSAIETLFDAMKLVVAVGPDAIAELERAAVKLVTCGDDVGACAEFKLREPPVCPRCGVRAVLGPAGEYWVYYERELDK